jgi:DNA-binding HxlR family transcriptional regulator
MRQIFEGQTMPEIDECTNLDGKQPERRQLSGLEQFICPVDEAARIIGQKWTLQIVHELLDHSTRRFCELQEALGGVNPSTLSSRLKMLEEEGLVHRAQVSTIPPHVEYSLTPMGHELRGVIQEITKWSNAWLCAGQEPCCSGEGQRSVLEMLG